MDIDIVGRCVFFVIGFCVFEGKYMGNYLYH